MRPRSLLLAPAVVVALALPAVADCADQIAETDAWLREEASVRESLDAVGQRDLRDLRRAALILDRTGQEDACEDVVDAMEEIAREARQAEAQDARMERLANAASLASAPGVLRADELIGRDIRNPQNEDLGEIDDVVLSTTEGRPSYAVVSYGGFLGIGEEQVAVPLTALGITEDRDILVLDMTQDAFEGAPRFDRDDMTTLSDEAWIETNNAYFAGEG